MSTRDFTTGEIRLKNLGLTEKTPGMGLAVKFALMVSAVVALVVVIYGTVAGIGTWRSMENDIRLRGVAQVQMLGLFGKRVIDLADIEDNIKREFELNELNIDEETMKRLTKSLHIPVDFLSPIGGLPSVDSKVSSDVVEAVVVRFQGASREGITSVHGENIRSLAGDYSPCVVRIGSSMVKVDVSEKSGWMEVGDKGEPVMEFVHVIKDDDGNDIGEARVVLSQIKILAARNRLVLGIIVGTIVAIGAAVGTSLILASIVVRPVKCLVKDMAIVSEGNLDYRTHVRSRDEIGLLSRTFNEMTKGLAIAQQNAIEKERWARDLNIAREIQEKLLPPRVPRVPGYDISAFYKPSKEVGGDYYDFIPIDKRRLAMVVADVSGKGIAGSLVMTMTRSIVRFEAQRNPSPADTLRKVNTQLSKEMRPGMFVTAFYLILDIAENTMTFSSAGHNPMVLVRNESRKQWILNPKGIALGFDKGPLFDKTINEEKVRLKKGDRVVLYTDGVVEAMDEDMEKYGEKRFYNFARELSTCSSQDFVSAVVADLEKHRGDAEQHDDITISTFLLS